MMEDNKAFSVEKLKLWSPFHEHTKLAKQALKRPTGVFTHFGEFYSVGVKGSLWELLNSVITQES